MTDFYLQNPPMQPKAEVADYVEQNGILVPRRFESLREGRKAVGNVLFRSEHPQDYAGISDLFNGKSINDEEVQKCKKDYEEYGDEGYSCMGNTEGEKINAKIRKLISETNGMEGEEELRELLFQEEIQNPKYYAELLGLDLEDVKSGLSYSVWEKIDGFNRTICGDSNIKGRYHIYSKRVTKKDKPDTSFVDYNYFFNHTTYDNGKLTQSGYDLTEDLEGGLEDLIRFYEQVRNLPNFDTNHCPILEVQTLDDGTNYFLQYHRGRDFEESTFILDREKEVNEIEVEFVRGATNPEGIEVNSTIYRPNFSSLPVEEGAFDMSYRAPVYTELMLREERSPFQFIDRGFQHIGVRCFDHMSKSLLLKPQISVVFKEDLEEVIGINDFMPLWEQTKKTNKPTTAKLKLVSDGRKAYIKYLG